MVVQETATLKWVERFARAFDCVRPDGERDQFIGDLVDAALQVSRAGRGYGILMKNDEVLAEAGFTAAGEPWTAGDPIRKRGARVSLKAVQERDTEGANRFPRLDMEEGTVAIPFIVRDDVAGCVILEQLDHSPDGHRDLGLTAALCLAQARAFNAREAEIAARIEAERAEHRRAEVEKAVASGGVGAVAFLKPVAELERDAIELALRTTEWNKEEAARRLGISRASIYMKVKKHGLQKPPQKSS